MSEPSRNYDNPAYGAVIELISAMSALNMEPDPINPVPEGAMYLSETDRMAKHSYDHMLAAYDMTQKTESLIDKLMRSAEMVLGLCHGIEWDMPDGEINPSPEWIIQRLTELYQSERERLKQEKSDDSR